jgi:hypothetical protein
LDDIDFNIVNIMKFIISFDLYLINKLIYFRVFIMKKKQIFWKSLF